MLIIILIFNKALHILSVSSGFPSAGGSQPLLDGCKFALTGQDLQPINKPLKIKHYPKRIDS